jgi:hypothetical protein
VCTCRSCLPIEPSLETWVAFGSCEYCCYENDVYKCVLETAFNVLRAILRSGIVGSYDNPINLI